MRISQDFLLELKSRNDIESVLSSYISLKRRGSNLVGLCPFHNEKTPSFTVYAEKGNYHCFGCGAGGDVITFIRQIENLDYIEAVKFLADRCGMQMPQDGVDDSYAKLKSKILEMNRTAARFFYNCLVSENGKSARNYLLNRGLTPQTVKHFGLGYAPDSWDSLINHLKSKGFSLDDMVKADLCRIAKSGRRYDRFRNRVMFPIIDLRGNVIAFSGRAMPGDDKSAKYMNTGDTPVFRKSHNMYGLNFAKNHCQDRLILVEGNLDVISLHQAGIQNAVAALGTAFTEDHINLISRYTNEVVVMFDADSAGKKATDRAIKMLQNSGLNSRVLRLPDCKDPDEYLKKYNASRLKGLIDGAVSDIEYKLYMAAEDVDLNGDEGKLQYLKKAAAVLAELTDDIAIDLYLGRLSSKYGVSKSALELEVEKLKKNKKRLKAKNELKDIVTPKYSPNDVNPEKRNNKKATRAEESIISVLMLHPDTYEKVVSDVTEEDFITEFNKRLFSAVTEVLADGNSFDLANLGEDFTPREIGYASEIMFLANSIDNIDKYLSDSIKVLKEEKTKMSPSQMSDLTDDEWATKMNELKNRNN